MKKMIILIFLLFFGLTTVLSADALFPWELSFMTDEIATSLKPYGNIHPMGKLGLGTLNIFFGMGSYIGGQWVDGLALSVGQILSLGVAAGGLYLTILMYNSMEPIAILLLSLVGLGIVPPMLAIGGLIMYGGYLINGFLYPFGYSFFPLGYSPSYLRYRNETRMDYRRRGRSFDMELIPKPEGIIAKQFTYTISY